MIWQGRTIITGMLLATAIVLSGCDKKPAQTAPGAPTATGQVIESNTRIVEEGQFYILTFNLVRPARVTISVTLKSGPPIDSYFVGEQGLNSWRAVAVNGQPLNFRYTADLTMAPLADAYSHTAPYRRGSTL